MKLSDTMFNNYKLTTLRKQYHYYLLIPAGMTECRPML